MDKKEEIIYATYKLFAEKGYNTSMSDIAKAVSIKVPSIYSHFQSKDEIIYAVMEKEIVDYFETLQQGILLMNNEGCEVRLERIYESVFEYFDTPEVIRFWKNISLINQKEIRTKCKLLVRKEEDKVILELKRIFEDGRKEGSIRDGDSEGGVFLYWVMIQGVLDEELMRFDIDMDFKAFRKKIWQTYWMGIKK